MKFLNLILLALQGVIVYAWIVFPALLKRSGQKRRPAADAFPEPEQLPRVAVVLSAYNEEEHIAERIRNLVELDYPPARWRAYIGVDGCKDRTAAEAYEAARGHGHIHVIDFEENRGKVSVLKDLVEEAESEMSPDILVFTDANTFFAADALRQLCRPFSDPAVGGVCGKLSFLTKGAKTEENVYWRFENWLKARESEVDSCLGANGAIYAIRRSLFWSEIPANTIIDDFVIGMKVREQNFRFLYEPAAVATEDLPVNVKDEWKRRVRIGAGNFQALKLCRACLRPAFGAFAWMFWSHKVLRWFTPHFMAAGCLLATLEVLRFHDAFAALLLGAYAAIGAVAWFGHQIGHPTGARQHPLMRISRGMAYFLTMQFAILVGFRKFFRGNLQGRWERTAR